MLMGFSIINFLIAFSLGALLLYVWSIANVLQLITLYPVLDIPLHSNTSDLFAKINKLVSFDIMPEELQNYMIEFLMDLPSDIPYYSRFADLGFETGYILATLFSQFIILIIGTVHFGI